MTFLHSGYNSKINLSAKEMLEISQEISRNFTPCFSSGMPELVEKTRLSSNELLDIGLEIARDFAPKAPHTINISELILLPVDPGHLYAYWNLGENREIPMSDDNGSKDQLTLRIYSQPDEDRGANETVSWFDVAIDNSETRQQVSLPPNPVDDVAYSAAIGKYCADHSFIAFAHSNIIHAPHGGTAWRQDHENSTNCLSKSASGQGISKQA